MNRKLFKRIVSAVVCIAAAASASGCASGKNADSTETVLVSENSIPAAENAVSDSAEAETEAFVWEDLVYEAEDAVLYGNLDIAEVDDFSGGKGVERFENDEQYIEFNIDIHEYGVYDLTFTAKGIGSDKENFIAVDGESVGTVKHLNEQLSESSVLSIELDEGAHTVALTKSWGWIQLDKMVVSKAKGVDGDIYNVTAELINPNATAETKALYKFLCDSYGEKIISGQVCDDGINGNEFKAIYDVTGKYPAMLGLDMMRYTPSRVELGDGSDAVETAIEFYDEHGGIVTFCWHWNAPTQYLKEGNDPDTGNPRWWGGFYTRNTDFDIAKVMNGEDEEGKKLLDEDIKAIAEQLNRLQDAGVPVIWRPLHEASGAWFWWGAKGADAYKQLWVYLYEQLTDVYGCNNLIWVFNGQSADWYPGDEYVDIVGEDIYPGKQVYSPQTAKFVEAVEYSGENKIVALTENGCVFDIDRAFATDTKWAWFNTWGGSFAVNGSEYSEEYTEKDILKKAYDSEYVISLDELPDLKNYQ